MNTETLLRFAVRGSPVLAGAVASATAAPLAVSVEIPRIDTAEYHRPYVAIWIEGADKAVTANIGVWYDVNMKEKEGETWLKDLRQWWRKSGRELDLPIDGVSGPTRPVGVHEVKIPDTVTAGLAAGEYTLVVEAAREVGGRELVRVPFRWEPDGAVSASATGERELGAVTIRTK